MVLTNFECWAHGGSNDNGSMLVDGVIERRNNLSVDLFNPNTLLQSCTERENAPTPTRIVSHLSSNGYYGFAQICTPNANVANDDVKTTNMLTSDDQMMDVEQHSINGNCIIGANVAVHMDYVPHQLQNVVKTTMQHNSQTVKVTTKRSMTTEMPVSAFYNGCSNRRKRLCAEDSFVEMKRRDAKRCRFDTNREYYLIDNNNGGCPSSYASNSLFPLSVDQEEIPVTISYESTNKVQQQANYQDNLLSTSSQIASSNEAAIPSNPGLYEAIKSSPNNTSISCIYKYNNYKSDYYKYLSL